MIVPMKKVTVLCISAHKEQALDALRGLGVLHVEHVVQPEGGDLDKARAHLSYARRALEVLPRKSEVEPSGQSAHKVVDAIWDLIHEKKDLEENLEALRHEEARIEAFGDFDPANVHELAERGISLKLYFAGPKQVLEAPEGAVLHILNQDAQGTSFVLIGKGDLVINAHEVSLPGKSLGQIREEISEVGEALEKNEQRLSGFAGDYRAVESIVAEADERVAYLEARQGMGGARPVAYLRGYCPADGVDKVREAAAKEGWGLVVEDPAGDDRVPTLIKTPKWAEPIKAVFSGIGILPGYDEVDISACFLVFFSLFFGMLVGDAAYGFIFLGLTFWAQKKFKTAPRQMIALLYITSICTILWGAISGTWFGIANLPAPLRGMKIDWLASDAHLMELCFLIGAVHLTIAHGWLAWLQRKTLQALAQLGWIASTWMMFFLARELVLGYDHMPFVWPVIGIAALFIALFMTPVRKLKAEWFGHAMLPLTIISNFVDVVSYVRLFAVGAATLAVASAFNAMALEGGITGVVSALVAAFILFVGHTLNLVMAIMGVMVHGIRLNTLEFSGHIGVEWKGFKYAPFARRAAQAEEAG